MLIITPCNNIGKTIQLKINKLQTHQRRRLKCNLSR